MIDRDKLRAKNARGTSNRLAKLNEKAQAAGYASWSTYCTAVIAGAARIK